MQFFYRAIIECINTNENEKKRGTGYGLIGKCYLWFLQHVLGTDFLLGHFD